MYICVCVSCTCVCVCVYQAQVQRSLDSAVSLQQRAAVGRRLRKEAGLGVGTDIDGQCSSPMSEQDSGVLDVEDEEDEDEVLVWGLFVCVSLGGEWGDCLCALVCLCVFFQGKTH